MIKLIASLIGERHKVNLKSPDKVILVDIYQVRTRSAVPAYCTWDANEEFRRFAG